jgi:DHA3 family macrolide efflux protein-like MFS transporter
MWRPEGHLTVISSGDGRRDLLWRVIAAEGISVAGDWVLVTAASIQVYRETGSTAAVSALLALAAAPTILLGAIAGAIADRHARTRIMVMADLAIATILLAAARAAGADLELATAYVAVLAAAISAAFHRPASEALLPVLAGPEQLGRANSILRLATRIAMIGGPALAGFLMSGSGFSVVLVFDAGTFLISAGVVVTITGIGAPSGAEPSASTFHAALEGWRYARRHRDISVVIGTVGATMVLGAIISAGTLAFVRNELRLPESRYGSLLAAEGAGAVVLATCFILLGRRIPLLSTGAAALAAMGAACAMLGVAPNLGAAMGVMAVMGMGEVGLQVAFSSYLQQQSEDAFRGRVMSLIAMVAQLGRLAGLALAGPAVDLLGVPLAFGAAGTLIVLSAMPVAALVFANARALAVRV